MRIVCPHCATAYAVDIDRVLDSNGLVQCHHCKGQFDVVAGPAESAGGRGPALHLHPRDQIADPAGAPGSCDIPGQARPLLRPDAVERLDDQMPDTPAPVAQPPTPTAFDAPRPRRPHRLAYRLLYALILVALSGALAVQLAWPQRTQLLVRFPQLAALCDRLGCTPPIVQAPELFRVLQRALRPAGAGSLALTAAFRNDAGFTQTLPDIQLSLLDSRGHALIRRRLAPTDYLDGELPPDAAAAPGEVFTIYLRFADPGEQATGFVIDFL